MKSAADSLLLTTAIPYVNAEPHVGHALELLIGDALARHHRQRGRQVYFTGGTDDHSSKNARAAEQRGVPTARLVSEHGATFRRLASALGARFDDYIHTSSDPRHAAAVVELWQRAAAAGDLYTRDYAGHYCTGCEAFWSLADAADSNCPIHLERLEHVQETNWFFRLSRYQDQLQKALETGALKIQPPERFNEVLSFVRGGLQDFSVSRSRLRARGWGIGVPGDASQIVYVWFDALASYLSVLGFPERTATFAGFWQSADADRAHLIGKDILRFHAVYWPAILLSAGLPLPGRIQAHGYVTSGGAKIGKSSGNAIDPFELVERFEVDAVRFYFLRHLHTTKDSDFRPELLLEAHDAELAGKLGNLLQRTSALALRHPSLVLRRGATAPSDADQRLAAAAAGAVTDVVQAVDDFALHQALASIFELVAAANRYADEQAPWVLSRQGHTTGVRQAAEDLQAQLAHVLWHLLEALRVTAILLAPFLPTTAASIVERIGAPREHLEALKHATFGAQGRFRPQTGQPLAPRRGSARRATAGS